MNDPIPAVNDAYYRQLYAVVSDLNKTVGALEQQLSRKVDTQVDQSLVEVRAAIPRLEAGVLALQNMVFGAPLIGMAGLLVQIQQARADTEALRAEYRAFVQGWQQNKWLLRGLVAGMTFNLGVTTGLLPKVLSLFTGP